MKKYCKTALNTVNSTKDGKVSSVISLQPVTKKPNIWKTLMTDWHLDKKVPIALIFAIFVQTMAGVWWASDVAARVSEQEHKSTAIAEYMDKQSDDSQRIRETLARLDERVKQQTEILASIERKTR